MARDQLLCSPRSGIWWTRWTRWTRPYGIRTYIHFRSGREVDADHESGRDRLINEQKESPAARAGLLKITCSDCFWHARAMRLSIRVAVVSLSAPKRFFRTFREDEIHLPL
jgi:hypothetical protein